jgi:predicted nucleotidyltransferase
MSEHHRQSKNEPCEQIHRWPTSQSKSWTATFLNLARKDENIMAVVAVGSAVRSSVRSSDLDLVVICREPARMKTKPPIEIDIRTYAVGRVDTLIRSGNDLLGWAVKFGRVLFQRERFWDAVVESWLDRLPFPSVDVALQRAGDSFRRLSKVLKLGDVDAAYEQALSYVTHLARAELLRRRVYPASRPELPNQLRTAGCVRIAEWLERLIDQPAEHSQQINELVDSYNLASYYRNSLAGRC